MAVNQRKKPPIERRKTTIYKSYNRKTGITNERYSDGTDEYYDDYGRLYGPIPKKTKEAMVIELLKGGFETKCGLSFQDFMEIYTELIEESPEKLI